MFRLIATLLVAASTLSACNSKPAGGDSNEAIKVENAATQMPSGPAPQETRGQDFVSSVLGNYDFALASAKLLAAKGASADGKRFGQKMAAELGASLDALKAIATKGNLKLEPVADPTDQGDLAILSSATGLSLEKAFAAQQLNRLSELLGLIRAYKNGGDNPELKAWAERAQTVVNDKLLGVQSLKAELDEADDK